MLEKDNWFKSEMQKKNPESTRACTLQILVDMPRHGQLSTVNAS